ncbi:hypothetical protein Aut01nite_84540 [Actinoplanes utahensis]|nr:hypothetical protein Aut01nite_84540 [Actinoplanes utahensis]
MTDRVRHVAGSDPLADPAGGRLTGGPEEVAQLGQEVGLRHSPTFPVPRIPHADGAISDPVRVSVDLPHFKSVRK